MRRVPTLPPNPVGLEVEPPRSLEFSVSGLKRPPGLNLGTPDRLVRTLAHPSLGLVSECARNGMRDRRLPRGRGFVSLHELFP